MRAGGGEASLIVGGEGGRCRPDLPSQDLVDGRALLQGTLGHHLGPHLLHIQHEGVQRLLHMRFLLLFLLHGHRGLPGKAYGCGSAGPVGSPTGQVLPRPGAVRAWQELRSSETKGSLPGNAPAALSLAGALDSGAKSSVEGVDGVEGLGPELAEGSAMFLRP